MPPRPAMAKSELEIARIVWKLGSATVREVLEQLPKNRNLDFKTVQTYLRRLESKGYFKTKKEGRSKVYLAKVRADRVVREVVDDFMERLFDGEAIPLLQHLINDRGLSDDEIRKLREMLNRLEGEQNDSRQ
ncbi:MAG: BlaI/MecI/CopY family transcriptional regulator [Chloroflexi bacterium]|nr:BlaI/MecI/CopY family transcriptional regulator [Chloroflexota bacterium]